MSAIANGYWTPGRIRGVPVRLHWTIPIGMLFFSRLEFAPVAWAGIFGLILLHELGHAACVKFLRQRVLSVDVMGFGGLCRWEGRATALGRCFIAWGGVLAQAVLLLIAWVAFFALGGPSTPYGYQLYGTLVGTNLYMIVFNLFPLPPLDGAECWKIIPLMRARWQGQQDIRRAFRAQEKAAKKAEAEATQARTDRAGPARDEIFDKMVKQATETPRIDPSDEN